MHRGCTPKCIFLPVGELATPILDTGLKVPPSRVVFGSSILDPLKIGRIDGRLIVRIPSRPQDCSCTPVEKLTI